ncbi:aspartyl/asparaginyl beta-hydroxylase domain-containing protein [Pseudomonas phoenicis]|uniref:aspartyl/asparaginyl beta-hydroxylase domain-containing protein n=1 Tax=unclassified Pseudomonas TaxID=196821 RepID=UPI0039A21896
MASEIIGTINIEHYQLGHDIERLRSIRKQPEEYDEFGQGHWKNISLYNATGEADDTRYKNARRCLPTEHLRQCPAIAKLIQEQFEPTALRMVRARSLVDGLVIPHRDFVELDTAVTYYRVFLALEDNAQAFHSDEQGVFQMRAGEVWYLDAGISHAAINFGLNSRTFLCLDFIYEQRFEPADIFKDRRSAHVQRHDIHIKRVPLQPLKEREIIAATATLIECFTFKDIVFALSKYHFIYDLPVASCYDWIISAAEQANNAPVLEKAKTLRRYLIEHRAMGERYALSDWTCQAGVAR